MQTNVVFWNVKTHNIGLPLLFRMVEQHNVHVLLLCESPFTAGNAAFLLAELNKKRPGFRGSFVLKSDAADKVQVVSRPTSRVWWREKHHEHYTTWSLVLNGGPRLLLTAAHFPAIQEDQGDEPRKVAIELCADLRVLEQMPRLLRKDENQQKQEPYSLLVGDLNANPI